MKHTTDKIRTSVYFENTVFVSPLSVSKPDADELVSIMKKNKFSVLVKNFHIFLININIFF